MVISIMRVEYIGDVKHGVWKQYYSNGNVEYQGEYVEGIKHVKLHNCCDLLNKSHRIN